MKHFGLGCQQKDFGRIKYEQTKYHAKNNFVSYQYQHSTLLKSHPHEYGQQ